MVLETKRIRLLISQALLWLLIAGFAAYEIERSRRESLREAETTTVFQAQAFAENTRSTIKRLNELLLNLRTEWHGDWERFAAEVPPVISVTGNLVKSVFEKENGLEEEVFRRADHQFLAAGRGRRSDQGTMPATRFQ